jgi:hypothetical protein
VYLGATDFNNAPNPKRVLSSNLNEKLLQDDTLVISIHAELMAGQLSGSLSLLYQCMLICTTYMRHLAEVESAAELNSQ